jgi:hypothetical protein
VIEEIEGINGTQMELNTQVALATEFPVVMETNKLATVHHLGQGAAAKNGRYGTITVNRTELSHASFTSQPNMKNVLIMAPFPIATAQHETDLQTQIKQFEDDQEGEIFNNSIHFPKLYQTIDDIMTTECPIDPDLFLENVRQSRTKFVSVTQSRTQFLSNMLNMGFKETTITRTSSRV